MTHTDCGLNFVWIHLAAAGPCTASLPSPRKKFVQPFFVRPGLVADGVMLTRPAALSAGPSAFDSPENGRPTMPDTAWLCWLTASSVALAIACPRAAFWPARVPT